ncbi:LytR/AlgR family response regulator transcription factor [Chitinilyticum piscinae]|uniref:Response regulator transcription factor n=1 Tax=Chitinilyticum piscinae TaxID=2866724 RepID=A0A8J7FYR4_9NEIS|nr:LytTR family DNA-binding domain-containing protein [Chitinilyticum piscinae]MBE9608153.1 response regulator transcription factor [Chitinilyticum piscinae]
MSKPLRIFLVDDELPALNRLQDLLADCRNEVEHTIAGTATNGMTALAQLAEHPVDLVILDIQMPQMSGIEVARKLLELPHHPAVVFATAFEDYGVAAFDVRAVDYLLKPIRHERLLTALHRVLDLQQPRAEGIRQDDDPHGRSHFTVSERGRVHLVPVADACYLKAEQKYITLRTREREFLLEDSLTRLEDEFGPRFLRIHRNCLVARDAVAGFERVPNGSESHWVVLLKGLPERLAVSRRQQHVIKEFREHHHDG